MFGRDQLESLPGRAFPGGTFLITAQEDAAMRDVVGAPPRTGSGDGQADGHGGRDGHVSGNEHGGGHEHGGVDEHGGVGVDVAHPIWMFAGPQRAMGISIDDLFGWCGSSSADGPMLGETELTMPGPLLIGRRYAVTGGIVAAERKQGRRAGVFDIVTFELNLEGGWQCRTSFVFPRRP